MCIYTRNNLNNFLLRKYNYRIISPNVCALLQLHHEWQYYWVKANMRATLNAIHRLDDDVL